MKYLFCIIFALPALAAPQKDKMASAYAVLYTVTESNQLDEAYRAALLARKSAEYTSSPELVSTVPKMKKAYVRDREARHQDVYLTQLIAANRMLKEALDTPDLVQAAENLRRVQRDYPLHTPTMTAVSQNLLERGKLAKARLYLDRIIDIEPEQVLWPVLLLQARIKKAEGFHDSAVELAKKAAKIKRPTGNNASRFRAK